MAHPLTSDGVALTDRIRAMLATGQTRTAAACKLGMSAATLDRWLKRRAMADESGDRTFLVPDKSSGRPAVARDLPPDATSRLKRSVLKCGSVALAVQHFADDPLCPDALREKILAMPNPHAIPLSLRRAAAVTPEMKAQFRGPVAYSHIAFKCRHSGEVIDPVSGETRDLAAGDLYLSDDMSRNRYYWFELPDHEVETRSNRGDKLAHKYGVALGRQGLYTMDATGKWLNLSLIGCAKDAYNSGDVLRHIRAVLDRWGKPRIGWIFEKGVWSAQAVDGRKIFCEDQDRDRLLGGIQGHGFLVEHVHTSEGKALIEGGFNRLQQIQSLYEGAPDIGRVRGEMERETKLIQRVQAGTVHPVAAGIEHISEALANDLKAMTFFNGQQKYGRIQHGVPDERWVRDTGLRPLAKLDTTETGAFMPIKHETAIRQGCLEKKLGGQIFRFTMPETFAQLGAGYRLMLCFDDTNPAAGAEVFNLETGARNVNAWPLMHHVGRAEWENARPLFGYSDQVANSIDRAKRFRRAFQTATVDTGIFGHRARKAVEIRDGQGNLAAVETIGSSTPDSGTDLPAIPETSRTGGVRSLSGSAVRSLSLERGSRNAEVGSRRRIRSYFEMAETNQVHREEAKE